MALKVTLKANETIVVNGCVISNVGRAASLTIENRADVVRGRDLIAQEDVKSPVTKTYFMIQMCLTSVDARSVLVPMIQSELAGLAVVMGGDHLRQVFEAANFVSQGDFYKALTAVRVLKRAEEGDDATATGSVGYREAVAAE